MGSSTQNSQCPKCFSLNPEDSTFCSHCGIPLKEKPDTYSYPEDKETITGEIHFSPGDMFGERYQIIEEIGRGGMGRVYKARDLELGTEIALKIIRPDYTSKPRFIEQFKQETLLARSISHENVIRIFDIGEAKDTKYISMEYIKGQSLKELIRSSGSLTVETVIHLTSQICSALSSAHKKKVIHRDLKPSNIMVDRNGHIHIMDFGLALLMGKEDVSFQKRIVGTPPYFSPEQAKGLPLNQTSDLYNVGCILYEMLTGQQPFKADSTEEYIEKHLHERPPSPLKEKPGIPLMLEKIVLKCLEKTPESRYQSAEDILKDMGLLQKEIFLSPHQKKKRQLKKILLILGLILVFAIPIYFIFLQKNPEESTVPELTRMTLCVLPFQNNSREPALDNYRLDFQEMIITDIEQSKYLHVIPSIKLNSLLIRINQQPDDLLSTDVLDSIAKDEKIQYYIQGNYSKFGDTLRFNVKIVKPDSYEALDSRIIEFMEGDDVLDRIDELTIWVKTSLGFTRYELVNDFDEKVTNLTNSQQALQLYFKGRRYYIEGDFEKSNQVLEEAIKLDQNFAMAYRNISSNYAYLQEREKAVLYAQKALELAQKGRGSLRQRLLIQGYAHYFLDRSPEQSVEDYKRILKIYPEDYEAHSFLGAIYRNSREWDQAEFHFLKVLLSNPDIALENLVWIYSLKGLYSKALDLLQDNDDLINPLVFSGNMANIYFFQGKTDLALKFAKKIESTFPQDFQNIAFIGNVFQIQGDISSAKYYYLSLMKSHDWSVTGLNWQFNLMIQEGRYNECENEIQKSIAEFHKQEDTVNEMDFLLLLAYIQNQNHKSKDSLNTCNTVSQMQPYDYYEYKVSYLKGLTLLELNKIEAAENEAEKLKSLLEESTPQSRLYPNMQHLRGKIAEKKGAYTKAIEYFEQAYSLLPYQNSPYDEHAVYLDALAQINYLAQNLDTAADYYTKIQNLSSGRLHNGDIYAKSYYWLGLIALQQSQTQEAIKQFQVFLDLWKNADKDILEIKDAINRLKDL